MIKWLVIQVGWLLVAELMFYGTLHSVAIGLIIAALDKFGERK